MFCYLLIIDLFKILKGEHYEIILILDLAFNMKKFLKNDKLL